MKDNGYFITQQVGGLNDIELNTFLETEDFQFQDWNLTKATKELLDAGFEIITMKENQKKNKILRYRCDNLLFESHFLASI